MTVTDARAATVGTDQTGVVPCCEPPTLAGPVTPPEDEQLAMLAKAIAHPVRLTILRLLSERSTCTTGDVVEQLPLAQSTVSEHLRILREAGLVTGEIEGPRTRYCIDPTGLALLHAGVATL